MPAIRVAALGVLFLMLGGILSAAVHAQVADSDGDGIPDQFDNCTLVAQAQSEFVDTNLDGFGNVCDPDFNDDLFVDNLDLPTFSVSFGFAAPPAGAITDLDLDGVTGIPDAIVRRAYYLIGAPGPSGLPCAGISVPCN